MQKRTGDVSIKNSGQGRLKIFMGYAPGVGKTYAMLEAAHQFRSEGGDVALAWCEEQPRPEISALMADFDIIPGRTGARPSPYIGIDVDAVISRRPELLLVDDLVLANPPDSRHTQRYQDVEDILAAGVNVFATLNVQNIESLKDVIYQITGVTVTETVPDRIVDRADEIDLIDLSPDALFQRLKEGKVKWEPAQAESLDQLFHKGNLSALRELSMRLVAGRVDAQMRGYMKSKEILGPWPASERLLVAVSSHPLSERLVRTARRLAEALKAEWYAVYVETPDRVRFSPYHSLQVFETMHLAEELGARTMIIAGHSVPEAILTFAAKNNITKIIAGKPLRPKWQEFLFGSPVDEIIRNGRNIDVYVINDERGPIRPRITGEWLHNRRWRRYLLSLFPVGMATLFSIPVHYYIESTNLVMLYLAAVVFVAVYLGRGPSILASLLSVIAFDFFFVNPRLSLTVTDTQYILTFLGLFAVGMVISELAAQLKDQVEISRQREAYMAALYALSRELTEAKGIEPVLTTIIHHLNQTFERSVVILLPDGKKLKERASSLGFILNSNENSVATWAFEHRIPAGRGTNTLPSVMLRYMPLMTATGVVGVLGVKPGDENRFLSPEKKQLMDAYASLAAMAIERVQLDEQASQTQALRATEKLQTALLDSISHDLRTPLVAITGTLENLQTAEQEEQSNFHLDRPMRLNLIENALEQAHRLNRLVRNLLDMTRLEGGAMKVTRELNDIQEVIGAALADMRDRLMSRQVKVEIPSDLPLVPFDFVLIQQVLINLLDNAIKYSASDLPVLIRAFRLADDICVSVISRGTTIPEDDLERVFEKFYRAKGRDTAVGVGLGLSICRGIVEVHGGRIWAENNGLDGCIITFALPGAYVEENIERRMGK